MRPIQKTRLENVRRLVKDTGGTSAFSAKIQRDPSYISQIAGTAPTKAVGDRMARHIESCFKLPEGWLDQEHALEPGQTYATHQPEASILDRKTVSSTVTLPFARIENDSQGRPTVSTSRETGGVPSEALAREGITHDEAMLVAVHGDAHGQALPDGSIVAVNMRNTSPIEGKAYAIRDSDLLRVRVLVPHPGGGLTLRTFNRADYPDEALSPHEVAERIEVIGRVFWSSSPWR